MSKMTESAIEEVAIKLFERLGYSAIYAPFLPLQMLRNRRALGVNGRE